MSRIGNFLLDALGIPKFEYLGLCNGVEKIQLKNYLEENNISFDTLKNELTNRKWNKVKADMIMISTNNILKNNEKVDKESE